MPARRSQVATVGQPLKPGFTRLNKIRLDSWSRLFVTEGFYRVEAGGFCGGPHAKEQTHEG